MFVPQPIFPHISVRSSYFGRIPITKTSSHHPYQALSYEQDLTLNDIAIIQITVTQTSRHPPSVSRIITPAVSPRHHHKIPIIQTRPDTVTLDITTPSLSHRHQHNITATQTSRHNHQQADINTQSLSYKRQHNFPVTQSWPARFYILSAIFSLSRIVVAKINMWGYHGFSGPRLKFFSCLNFKHGFFTFFTTCLARRASPPSP